LELREMKYQENGESCRIGSSVICTHPQISLCRSNQENEVGRACGMYGREQKVYKFWWGSPKERELRRPRCRWENRIRMDHREISRGCGVDSPGLG
jgi:hypothetical protein